MKEVNERPFMGNRAERDSQAIQKTNKSREGGTKLWEMIFHEEIF
jgi:hypothetical protein